MIQILVIDWFQFQMLLTIGSVFPMGQFGVGGFCVPSFVYGELRIPTTGLDNSDRGASHDADPLAGPARTLYTPALKGSPIATNETTRCQISTFRDAASSAAPDQIFTHITATARETCRRTFFSTDTGLMIPSDDRGANEYGLLEDDLQPAARKSGVDVGGGCDNIGELGQQMPSGTQTNISKLMQASCEGIANPKLKGVLYEPNENISSVSAVWRIIVFGKIFHNR